MEVTIAVLAVVVAAIVLIAKTAVVVPQQSAYVIENLGKCSRTLRAGFHIRGFEAMPLRIAQEYVAQFGELAKEGNTLVVPANLTDLASMMALATNIVKRGDGGLPADTGPGRTPR